MEIAIIAALAIVGYALFASQNASALNVPPGQQQQGGFLGSLFRPQARAIQPQGVDYSSPGGGFGAQQAVSLGGTGASTGLALAGVGGPIGIAVGAGVAVIATVVGLISQHHKEAVAKEGRGMAVAIAHWNTGLAILIQAATAGRYGRQAPVNTMLMEADLNQLYSDYKTVVGPIIKGSPGITPPHAVYQPSTASYHITPGSSAGGASPCNGPCAYAKAYLVPQWNQALQEMIWAARGIHGTFVIPPLTPNAAKQFPGAQGVSVGY